MSIGLQVDNLPGDARAETLVALLSAYGEVRVLEVQRRGLTLSASCRGFVELPDRKDAARAVRALNGRYYRGRLLHVESVQVDR